MAENPQTTFDNNARKALETFQADIGRAVMSFESVLLKGTPSEAGGAMGQLLSDIGSALGNFTSAADGGEAIADASGAVGLHPVVQESLFGTAATGGEVLETLAEVGAHLTQAAPLKIMGMLVGTVAGAGGLLAEGYDAFSQGDVKPGFRS